MLFANHRDIRIRDLIPAVLLPVFIRIINLFSAFGSSLNIGSCVEWPRMLRCWRRRGLVVVGCRMVVRVERHLVRRGWWGVEDGWKGRACGHERALVGVSGALWGSRCEDGGWMLVSGGRGADCNGWGVIRVKFRPEILQTLCCVCVAYLHLHFLGLAEHSLSFLRRHLVVV